MSDVPKAREVILRKLRPLAPPFHEHIARSRLRGEVCRVGDRVVVYEITRTVPEGAVAVTGDTLIRFE